MNTKRVDRRLFLAFVVADFLVGMVQFKIFVHLQIMSFSRPLLLGVNMPLLLYLIARVDMRDARPFNPIFTVRNVVAAR